MKKDNQNIFRDIRKSLKQKLSKEFRYGGYEIKYQKIYKGEKLEEDIYVYLFIDETIIKKELVYFFFEKLSTTNNSINKNNFLEIHYKHNNETFLLHIQLFFNNKDKFELISILNTYKYLYSYISNILIHYNIFIDDKDYSIYYQEQNNNNNYIIRKDMFLNYKEFFSLIDLNIDMLHKDLTFNDFILYLSTYAYTDKSLLPEDILKLFNRFNIELKEKNKLNETLLTKIERELFPEKIVKRIKEEKLKDNVLEIYNVMLNLHTNQNNDKNLIILQNSYLKYINNIMRCFDLLYNKSLIEETDEYSLKVFNKNIIKLGNEAYLFEINDKLNKDKIYIGFECIINLDITKLEIRTTLFSNKEKYNEDLANLCVNKIIDILLEEYDMNFYFHLTPQDIEMKNAERLSAI